MPPKPEKSQPLPATEEDVHDYHHSSDDEAQEPVKPARVTCECGKELSKKHLPAHLASAVHMKTLAEKKIKQAEELKAQVVEKKDQKETAAIKISTQFDLLNKKLDKLMEDVEDILDALYEDDEVEKVEVPKVITTKLAESQSEI